jgi:hypothetical protein
VEPLDLEGIFWDARHPEARVAGRLRFDVAAGAELALIGSFGNVTTMMDDHEPRRILGIAGKRLLTLEECRQSGSTFDMPGIYRERYEPSLVLSGAHFEADETLEFSAVTVRIRHLDHWVGKSGLELKLTETEGAGEVTQYQLAYTPLSKERVPGKRGELELSFTWGLRGDHLVESILEQQCHLRLQPSVSKPVDELVKASMDLQHLVTLGVDASAPVTRITFWHPAVTHTGPNGLMVHDGIELYARLQGGDAAPLTRRRLSHDMLFTFDDLGGLAGVSRWLGVTETFEAVIGALLSHWYMPRMYSDNRLHNAVFAAETFHRLKFPNRLLPKAEFQAIVAELVTAVPNEHQVWLRDQLQYSNEPRLKQRLLELARYAGSSFSVLVGDVDDWSSAVRNARNSTVHQGPGKKKKSDGTSLYLLSESVYFLVALCLLREAGAPDAAITKAETHERYMWLSRQLKA